MAVAAIEAIEADVMFVAERNGLRADHVLASHIRRPGDCKANANEKGGAYSDRDQSDAQRRICVGVEKLRHDFA